METQKQKILKNKNFNVRLSAQQRKDFKKICGDNGKVLSDSLRDAIDHYIELNKK
jgi:uncharacterized LabA/DUF88 family protein